MRIISNFRDYYDNIQSYGQDQSILYIRKREYRDIKIPLHKYLKSDFLSNIEYPSIVENPDRQTKRSHVGTFILGYCGELYRGHVIKINKDINPLEKKSYYEVIYNKESLLEYQRETKYSLKNPSSRYISKWKENIDFFSINNQDELKEIFFDYNVPLFIIAESEVKRCNNLDNFKGNLTLNPNLAKYKFQQIKDPFTTYQDISMFVGGVLTTTGNEMVPISNESMIKKKGFDKWSFRTPPKV